MMTLRETAKFKISLVVNGWSHGTDCACRPKTVHICLIH